MSDSASGVLILGIGNVLLGDEGVGVHLVRHLEEPGLPEGVSCLDGGTGSFQLLGPILECRKLILVDACADPENVGRIQRLSPRFSSDYPPSLTAHDIGLKDLLDSLYLLGNPPDVVLYAISIDPEQPLQTELSPVVQRLIPDLARMVLEEAKRTTGAGSQAEGKP